VIGWIKLSGSCWTNPADYRISTARGAGGLNYCAWAPTVPAAQFEAALKVRYARGERVPQMRPLIGCYASADEARMACAEHAEKKVAA
jgi:hypothetical protein